MSKKTVKLMSVDDDDEDDKNETHDADVTKKYPNEKAGIQKTTDIKQRRKTCSGFLRKAYHMIETCDSKIIGWTTDGKAFVINDPDTLASHIIPRYFKHSNITSFVRQLNFYGFRKIRNEGVASSRSSKKLCFRHDRFVRGRPDLLVEIQKPTSQKESPSQKKLKGIESLKSDIQNLKKNITTLVDDVQRIKSVAKDITKLAEINQERQECLDSNKKVTKKARIDSNQITHAGLPANNLELTSSASSKHPGIEVSLNESTKATGLDLFSESICDIEEIWNDDPSSGIESSSDSSDDGKYQMEGAFNEIIDDGKQFKAPSVAAYATQATKVSSKPRPSPIGAQIGAIIGTEYAQKLYSSIEMLPAEIRPLYTAEQLLLSITDPEILKKQIDDIFKLANEMNTSHKQMSEYQQTGGRK